MRKIIRCLPITIFLLVLVSACGQKAPTWQEQYDLGVRYLFEGDYEEAIIAFTAAIEIDPKQAPAYVGRGNAYIGSGETEENLTAAQADYKQAIELDETNADAYLGLADVYIRRGEYDKALEVLRDALDKIKNDKSIADEIAEIESNTSALTYGKRIGRLFENGYRGNGISIDEVSIMGRSITGLDITTMKNILLEKGFGISTNQEEIDAGEADHYWLLAESLPDVVVSPEIDAFQYFSSQTLDLWGYRHRDYYHGDPLPVGLYDIYTQDSIETVLTKLGFDNGSEIVVMLNELASITFPNMDAMYEDLVEAQYTFDGLARFSISLDPTEGTHVDYENSEEVRWHGAVHDPNCSIGFKLSVYCNATGEPLDETLSIAFDFENGCLESVNFW